MFLGGVSLLNATWNWILEKLSQTNETELQMKVISEWTEIKEVQYFLT